MRKPYALLSVAVAALVVVAGPSLYWAFGVNHEARAAVNRFNLASGVDDKCDAATDAARAYASAGDEKNYNEWEYKAGMLCLSAYTLRGARY